MQTRYGRSKSIDPRSKSGKWIFLVFLAAGLKTTRLKRIAEGPVQLGDLKPGQWRSLTAEELARLQMEE